MNYDVLIWQNFTIIIIVIIPVIVIILVVVVVVYDERYVGWRDK